MPVLMPVLCRIGMAKRRGGEGTRLARFFVHPPSLKVSEMNPPPRFRESSRCLIRRVSDESLNDRFRRWLRCGVRLIATNCGTLQCGRGRGMKGNEVAFHFAYHLCSRGGIIDASLRMFRRFSLGRGKFRSVFRSSGILERSKIDNSRDKNRFLSKCNVIRIYSSSRWLITVTLLDFIVSIFWWTKFNDWLSRLKIGL